MDIAAALKQYGFVGTLANSIPELRTILSRAAAGNWTADEFSRAVQDSKWWKGSADAVKQYQILKATKPGEWRAQQDVLHRKTISLAAEMGVAASAPQLGHLTVLAQMHGWDEATLRSQIGHLLRRGGQTYGGQAGEIQQQIRQLYYDMGIRYNSATVNDRVRAVLSGVSTIQNVTALVQQQAKTAFPALAAQIDAGHTVRQIADPYIQAKAQLLEQAPETVTLADPLVRRGLSYKDPKTAQIGLMPLWQYEQQVKADPKWQQTKNAHDDYATLAHQIGRDWGFAS